MFSRKVIMLIMESFGSSRWNCQPCWKEEGGTSWGGVGEEQGPEVKDGGRMRSSPAGGRGPGVPEEGGRSREGGEAQE